MHVGGRGAWSQNSTIRSLVSANHAGRWLGVSCLYHTQDKRQRTADSGTGLVRFGPRYNSVSFPNVGQIRARFTEKCEMSTSEASVQSLPSSLLLPHSLSPHLHIFVSLTLYLHLSILPTPSLSFPTPLLPFPFFSDSASSILSSLSLCLFLLTFLSFLPLSTISPSLSLLFSFLFLSFISIVVQITARFTEEATAVRDVKIYIWRIRVSLIGQVCRHIGLQGNWFWMMY